MLWREGCDFTKDESGKAEKQGIIFLFHFRFFKNTFYGQMEGEDSYEEAEELELKESSKQNFKCQ